MPRLIEKVKAIAMRGLSHNQASDATQEKSLGSASSSDSDVTRNNQANPEEMHHESKSTGVGSIDPEDPNIVTWAAEDPENPLNWSNSMKWAATLLISSFTFISPVSSTMVAPALPAVSKELQVRSSLEEALVMSIFLLAYAVGPFVLGPLSEIFGRVKVMQFANLEFLVFNTACGFAQTKAQLLAFRFLSGLGGSAPQALGNGVLSDVWRTEERGKGVGIYSLAPFIGPAVGPIAGGFIAQYSTWRWVFWSVSIVDAGVQVLAFLFLRETYHPVLLARRAKKMRKETGNEHLRTKWEEPGRTFGTLLRRALERPFIMLFTQPAVQAVALYRAYLYGIMYLVLNTFPSVWRQAYGYSVSIASLNYISLGVGFVLGIQFCSPINDRLYNYLKIRYNSAGVPEFRIPLKVIGGLLVPIGMFIYGWTVHYRTHWIGPNIGAGIFAFGLIVCFNCAQAYIVDAYVRYAASAAGAVAFLRTLAGFGFPLFAPAMYDSLGVAWGNSMLAFISLALGTVSPFLLWRYGAKLRELSPYCAG